MQRHYTTTVSTGFLIAMLFWNSSVQAEGAHEILEESKMTVQDAVAKAKQSGLPLIVFGSNPGCHNCAAVKHAIESNPDIKALVSQYVAVEVAAGSPESRAIVKSTEPKGSHINGYTTPLVVIFTAKGENVFASHVTPVSEQSPSKYKELLIEGIKKNGGLHNTTKSSPSLSEDVAKARKLLKDNQPLDAANAISKYSPVSNQPEDLAALVKLTNLQVVKSKSEEQLDSLFQEVSEKSLPLVQAAVTSATSENAIRSAVQLTSLERTFNSYPAFAGKFDTAWNELLEKAKTPNLKEQAKMIDTARQSESEPAKAITGYELVTTTYPGTKAAELSQIRITQLKKKVPQNTAGKTKS